MQNPTDTLTLRREFADRFLASPQDHDEKVLDGPMQELIDAFDSELAGAKGRWSHLDVGSEWNDMERWLSDRQYIDPEYLEV